MRKWIKRVALFFLFVIIVGLLWPSTITSPIAVNHIQKIDSMSFWYYPWGKEGVHKGIDMFCNKHTPVLAPVGGFVIQKGQGAIGGTYLYLLGPKWKLYYFAHLDTVTVERWHFVNSGDTIGLVGNTGNAINKPPHLHFSIQSLLPYFWLYDTEEVEGWKKMFYLNPVKQLGLSSSKDRFLVGDE